MSKSNGTNGNRKIEELILSEGEKLDINPNNGKNIGIEIERIDNINNPSTPEGAIYCIKPYFLENGKKVYTFENTVEYVMEDGTIELRKSVIS